MARTLPFRLLCCIVTAFTLLAIPSFAADQIRLTNKTNGATINWNTSGFWTNQSVGGTGVPTSAQDALITNLFGSAGTMVVTGAAAATTINFLQVGSTDSGATDQTNKVIFGNTFTSSFGMINNARGVVEVTNTTAIFGINSSVTFNNSGNLNIKNNGTFLLNSGGVGEANNGTITMDTVTASGTPTFNYISAGTFTNVGTIVKVGASGAVFLGTDGAGNNRAFANTGTINVQAGQLIINPGDAFSGNGFNNTGTILINSATFTVDRTANAWANNNIIGGVGVWSNKGNVILNNGTYTLRKAGAAFAVGTNNNNGTFMGSGNLRFNVNNDGGTLYGSNGTLVLEQNLVTTNTSSSGTLIAGDSTGAGTISFQGGNVNNGATLSGTITITNNSAIIFSGDASWTLNSAATYGGTGAVDRGSIISSNATGGSDTLFLNNNAYRNNNGTLSVVNTNGINYGQIGGDLTNNFVITGLGSFTGNFGGNNMAIVNKGTIAAVQGGPLTLDPRNAANVGGLSNTSQGTIIITNASTLSVVRSNTAWTGANSAFKNSGTILLNNGTLQTIDWGSGTTGNTTNTARFLHNDGTIIAQGAGTSTNTIQASLDNAGTVYVTNDTAVFNLLGSSSLTNTSTGQIILGGNGANGTLVATNIGRLVNAGTIQGQGTLITGVDAGGANASITNAGTIVATNFGANAQGTLTISTGNAFSNGGLLNGPAGTILVGTNMTLVFNRTSQAWTATTATAVTVLSNSGTIFLQGGTFMTSSGGTADSTAVHTNVNTGTITGWGTFQMLVTNGGQVLADARGFGNRNQGTLTVSLISSTNFLGSTLGTVGTNSTLNLVLPTGAGNTLINNGTVQFSAGNITINGATGTISNYFAIAGVGVLTNLPIVQVGASASLIAKTPTDGFTALVASVSPTNLNGQLLGAIGGAELRLTLSGGGNTIVNQGTMNIQSGGSISINGATGVISNDANGIFYGSGTNANTMVTSAISSKIQASNGVLMVGLGNNINTGSLEAFGATDQLILTNSILANQGTMKANAGTVDTVAGGTITNSGTIVGAGTYDTSIINASGGQIIANGQTQTLGNAASSFLNQTGGVIRVTGGTLNVDVSAWNNQGSITNASGAVLTRTAAVGVMTNAGIMVNQGSIGVQVINNANITNSGGTFVLSVTNNASILSSQGSFTGGTFANLSGGTFKGTNTTAGTASTNFINSTAAINTGTMIGGTAGALIQITNLTQNFVNQGTLLLDSPSTATNVAFDIRRLNSGTGDFTNDVAGVIQGAGVLRTANSLASGNNFNVWNKGTILATNGVLIVQPGDTFNNGGFVNMSGATATVASASTLGIQRTDNAWTGSGTTPRNEGIIQLNGGTFAFLGNSPNTPSLANDRSLSNAATGSILGNGTIEAGVINAGTINVNNSGTLFVDNAKTAAGPNIWGIQDLGTIVINTNNTLVLNRLAADWAANEGLNDSGTLRFNGGVYQSAVAGAINSGSTNFIGAGGTGGIYGNGTFDSALDAQSGTLSAEGGTLNFTHAVMNNVGNAVTAQALGSGNVLQFYGGASLSAGSSLKANTGGEVRFTGSTNSTVAGLFDNTGGFLTITGASVVFFTNNLARANLGTITLVAGGNFNYGGVGDIFTNATAATVRSIGNGSSITGNLGAGNFGFINRGSLSVESGGTLTIDPRDAFIVGFSNASTGSINVKDATSTFAISRTTGAWGGGDTVKNEGTIIMNGGTFGTFDTGGTTPNTTHLVQNDGTVQILGTAGSTVTFQMSVANAGLINVSTGLFTMVSPAGTTFTNLSSGTFRAGSETTRFTTNGNAAGSVNNVANAGTFSFENGTIAGGNFLNTGIFKVNHFGFGTFTINGTGNLFSNASSGSIFVTTGTNAVNGTVVNLGLIDGYGSGTFGVTSGANFTNAAGGLIINTNSIASVSMRAAADRFFNIGTMTVANSATLNVVNTGATGTSGASWLNQGALNVGDASSSGFFNSGQLNNAGAINGRGVIGLSTGGTGTPLANSGSINVLNSGLLVISNFASSVSGSQFTNSGLVNIGNAGSELRLISGITNGTGGYVGITNLNSGTILVNGGTLSYISTTEALLTNAAGGWIKGSGTITNAFIANRGTIVANGGVFSPLVLAGSGVGNSGVVSANVSAVVVKGAFNNSGTFAAIDSVGTFNSSVVNSGAWITDPSTLVFQNTDTITSSGYVQMSAGDTYIFTNDDTSAADYVNLSSKSNQYTTASGKFIFANTLGLTQNLVVAGINLGPGAVNPIPNATNQLEVGIDLLIPGFSNNFALGTLQISDFTTVRVTDAFSGLPGLGTNDGLMAGLYLNNLEMGVDSLLIISSNVQVYFEGSNTWNYSNFLLEGNPTFDNSISGLHQLAVIPEPGVVFLWLCGFMTFYAARRRAKNLNRS